eukprot:191145_1
MSAVTSLQELDDIIGDYYIIMGEGGNYYQDVTKREGGKFKRYVDENGLDDEDLQEEFDNEDNIKNCMYLEFDPHFPFDSLLNLQRKEEKLYYFLKYCYTYGRDPQVRSVSNKIDFEILDSFVDINKIKSTKNIYMQQCPEIWKHIKSDTNILMALTIGNEHKHHFYNIYVIHIKEIECN